LFAPLSTMAQETEYNIKQIHPLQAWRHVVQLITFLFINGKFLGLASTGIIVPYLWAVGAPFSTVHGAYEALEFSISQGVFPLLALGVIYLTAISVGRIFCGWACPFGMVQDFLAYLPFKKEKIAHVTHNQIKDIKWAVLGFSLFLSILVGLKRSGTTETSVPVGVFSEAQFSVISPSGTLFSYLPWMILWNNDALAKAGVLGWLKFGALIGVLVPSLYIPRFFCRYLCPLGALLSTVSPYKILRIYRPKENHESFNKTLEQVCPMGVKVEPEESFIAHGGCIHCGKCVVKEEATQQFF
jgi:ferredoxin-type protein NapH